MGNVDQRRPNKEDIDDLNREKNNDLNKRSVPVDGSANKGVKKQPPKPSVRKNAVFSWQNVGFWDTEDISDKNKLLQSSKAIESYVTDHFYCDWYSNTSLVIGTCFFCWLIARLGGGLLSLGFVFLFTNSVYRVEFRRFNRNIRDDMTRIEAGNRLENQLETMEWMNSFLDKFWVIYMPELSKQVMFQANEVLKDQAPGFGIEALSLDEFTLGSKAPRVESIKSYTKKGHDHIEMDWAFSFAPNDTDDMTKNEIKKKINPKVALGVTIGKAFISKSLPILVEDMTFKGHMNIKFKLSQNFPHIKMVSVQFLEPPAIDYVLKPVGGDTLGLDIMSFIPGLSSFVNGLIHANLRPMLYAPNSLDVDVEEILAQQSNDATGCLSVTIKSCTRLKPIEKQKVIHPYVQLKVQNNVDIEENTKTKKDTTSPIYMETKYLLLNNLESNQLSFSVYNLIEDQQEDKLIGNVLIPLADLLQDDTQTNVVKNLLEGGRVVGKIEYDLKYYPTLEPMVLDDGTKETNSESEVGILKLTLHEAKDLDISHSVMGMLNPYAEIHMNNELVKSCRRVRQTNEPSWEQTLESLITLQSNTQVQIYVKDSSDDIIVGKLDANLQDLVFESSRGQEWIKGEPTNPNAPPCKIRISANWKALGMSNSQIDTQFGASIGGLKLHIRSASNLKNLESVGNVDPYIRVRMNGKVRGKTLTIADTNHPFFNSVVFLPIHNDHQHILLEIMDEEEEQNDRSLGTCAVHVNDFLKKNKDGYFLGYDGSKEIIEQPVLYNGADHGILSYSVSFVPTIPVYTLSQLQNKEEYHAYLDEQKKKEEKRKLQDEKLYKEHPNEYEWVEINEDNIPDPKRVEMPLERAIKYRTGNVVVHILSGRFDKPDVYVHTLFDDHAYPSGITPKSEGRKLDTISTGEGFIRDLPNSKLIFRLAKKFEVNDEKEIVLERILDTIEILKKAYSKPIELKLNEKNVIKVQLEFIPSAVKLAPLDTILDVGYLSLDILSATKLPSVDKNGKSDPFVSVSVDGVQVYKTDKKRKTLDPVWNEAVEIPFLSRSRQILLLEVFDWDLTHKPELLGAANLDLSTMEPFKSTQFSVFLDKQGEINLRAAFKPEYIRPKLNAASGLPIDFDAVKAAPIKAVSGAAGLAGSALGSGVGVAADGVAKGHHLIRNFGKSKKKSSGEHGLTVPDESDLHSQFSSNTSTTGKSGRTSRTGRASKNGRPSHAEDRHNGDGFNEAEESRIDGDDEFNGSQISGHKDKQEGEEEEHKPGPEDNIKVDRPKHEVHTAPNMDPASLPKPQKPHTGEAGHVRHDSDGRSFASSMKGPDHKPGRVAVVGAQGFSSSSLEVKTILKTPNREKALFKTRSTKADKKGIYIWSESSPFLAAPSSELIFIIRESHKFGKSVELGTASVNLSDAINKTDNFIIPAGQGSIVVNIKYV